MGDVSFLAGSPSKNNRRKKRASSNVKTAIKQIRKLNLNNHEYDSTDNVAFHSILDPEEMNSTLHPAGAGDATFNLAALPQPTVEFAKMHRSKGGSSSADDDQQYAPTSTGSYVPKSSGESKQSTPPTENANEAEQEWITDDESDVEEIKPAEPPTTNVVNETVFDNPRPTEVYSTPSQKPVPAPRVANKGKTPETSATESNTRGRKLESQYFTPAAAVPMSTRATTRAIQRIANSSAKAAPVQDNSMLSAKQSAAKAKARIQALTKQMKESVQSSGGSSNNSITGGSTVRGNRTVSRVKAMGSAAKELTESGQKRRKELEERRRRELQAQIEEKERRAAQLKEQMMQQKALEMKQKREEKERLVAQQKEQVS